MTTKVLLKKISEILRLCLSVLFLTIRKLKSEILKKKPINPIQGAKKYTHKNKSGITRVSSLAGGRRTKEHFNSVSLPTATVGVSQRVNSNYI